MRVATLRRDAEIMAARAGGATLAAIGAAMGISTERVRQIVARAAMEQSPHDGGVVGDPATTTPT